MENTLENLLTDSSFVLWLRGEGSAEQNKYWNNWLEKNPNHYILIRQAKEVIEAMDSEFKIPNPHIELEKLDEAIEKYKRRDRQESIGGGYIPKRDYRTVGIRIAAVVILILIMLGSLGSYYYNQESENITSKEAESVESQTEEYHTDYGEKLTFRLSDGSQITLNANSDLKFSSKIEKGLNTEVWLKGEAYFNIVHLENEQQRTFTVHTDDGSIQVLGTRFAVNTFQGKTKTVLEEGKVSIQLDSSTTTAYQLLPGELAHFKANDNKITVKNVNTQIYTSWKDDKIIFDNTPMKEIVKRIRYTYGIEVVIHENLSDVSLSGSIKSTNINVLKEALEEVLETQVTQQNKKLFIGK